MINRNRLLEIIRYVINGGVATSAHYGAFIFNLSFISPQSAGLANFLASFVGIIVSFFGSRYFVFCSMKTSIAIQFIRFSILYLAIAIVSGVTLFVWSDILELNKNIGFLIGVIIQVFCSYFGGRRIVFA